MATGARGTLWPTQPLQGDIPASSSFKNPTVLFLQARGHLGWVLARLNQDSPCPCECPCWRGLIRRAEPRDPRSASREGLVAMEQPVVEKETHGISPKATVPPWSPPRVPRCSPCQIRVGCPQTTQTLPGTPTCLCPGQRRTPLLAAVRQQQLLLLSTLDYHLDTGSWRSQGVRRRTPPPRRHREPVGSGRSRAVTLLPGWQAEKRTREQGQGGKPVATEVSRLTLILEVD